MLDFSPQEGYYSLVKRATISETKNNLSKLLSQVRRGETIVILDRNVPVARLEPVGGMESLSTLLPGLAREGVISLPAKELDVERFLHREKVRITGHAGAVHALITERSEGR